MVIKELSKLKTCPYSVTPLKQNPPEKPVKGFDTETHKGKVTLIADSEGRCEKIKDWGELKRFLFSRKNIKSINFFFNLEYDTNAIIKHLPKNKLMELASYNECIYEDARIKIIPRKCLSISSLKFRKARNKTQVNRTVKFFDIFQFYQVGSLVNTYEKVLKKPYQKRIDASQKTFEYSKIDQEDILYCIEDAKACQELAAHFVRLANAFVPVRDFYSPASLAKALLRKHLIKEYKFVKSPIQQMALSSYHGGRFETIKRGRMDVWQYDITSAYPDAIRGLYDTRGQVIDAPEYVKESTHSFFDVSIVFDKPVEVSPLKYFIREKGLLAYPIGTFNQMFLTKQEYETLAKDSDCKIYIRKALHILNDEPTRPFDYIEDVFAERKRLKAQGKPEQLVLKLAMNSAYGVMIQTTKKHKYIKDRISDDERYNVTYCGNCGYIFGGDIIGKFIGCPMCRSNNLKIMMRKTLHTCGQFYNPIYASEITAHTRCAVYNLAKEYEKHVVMFATDSVTFDCKVNKIRLGDELGEWTKTGRMDGLILGSGIYSMNPYERGKKINKLRGFGRQNLFEIAENNRKAEQYSYFKNKPNKLKESMKSDKIGYELMNVFEEKEKVLTTNFDQKRIWERDFQNFGDALENRINSKPIHIYT